MADESKPTSADIQQAADRVRLRTQHLEHDRKLAETLQGLGSIANAEAEALKRRDAAKALEAEALVALEKVKTEAATVITGARSDAKKIVAAARSEAQEIANRARQDLQTELASTQAQLETARNDLAATQGRLARARDALSG